MPYAWTASPFLLCAGNPPQDPGQASAPDRPPSSRLPVSPSLFATIKASLYSGAIARLFVFPPGDCELNEARAGAAFFLVSVCFARGLACLHLLTE